MSCKSRREGQSLLRFRLYAVLLSVLGEGMAEGRGRTLTMMLQHWMGPMLQSRAAAIAAKARVETAVRGENEVIKVRMESVRVERG